MKTAAFAAALLVMLGGCNNDVPATVPQGATVYEDGSWTAETPQGKVSGCLAGELCDDEGGA